MRVDILAKLHDGSITIDQADEIYDEVMESPEASAAPNQLGLSREEWTAFAHGVPFDILADWRYNGWPDICPVCHEKLDIPRYGWFAVEQDDLWIVKHTGCLNK